MGRLLRRLAYLLRQRRFEAELAEEMDFHREMKRQELESQGVGSTGAAQRAFGNVTLTREESRAVWIWPWPSSVVPAIREAVRSIDRNLPLLDVRTQTQQIDATLSQERLFVTLTTAFGIVALLLASIGIYGVVANGVTRRKTEIGIRIALGAQRGSVVRLILRETLVLAGVGTIGGILAAAALTRSVRAMLYGIVPLDPLAIAGAVAVMLSIAVLAAWIPARGASRLDPIVALRHE